MHRSLAPPGRLVDVGGHRLHLHCRGDGSPPVVFDAALGASSLSWTAVAERVAAVTRACTYDRAGFGWSDPGPLPRTAGRIADELFALLHQAGVRPPWVLVGHSYGGLVMRLLAARHRDAVAGLVLVEPAHVEDWIRPAEERRAQIARGVRLCRYGAQATRLGGGRVIAALARVGAIGTAWALVRLVSRGGLGRADEGILAPLAKLPPGTRPLLTRVWTRPAFFEALGSQIGSVVESARQLSAEGPDEFGDRPLVVITSAAADGSRLRADAAIAGRALRGRHVTVADCGHWIPLDDPASVAGAIATVVQEARARP